MKRFYRILLGVYPAGFREEYGTEMEQQFADEYQDAEGLVARFGLWWRTLADLAISAPREIARELPQDLIYAARSYRKTPVTTTFALAALALAIGVTTGTFSVLNAMLIRSLPFREPDRLVELSQLVVSKAGLNRLAVEEWRKTNAYLSDAAIYDAQEMNVGVREKALRLTVAETTAGFLQVLGSTPALGRDFSSREEMPGENRVAVIGYRLWEEAFGASIHAIGATITVNDQLLRIVGVAPPDFDFPSKASVWTPSLYDRLPSTVMGAHYIGHLKPGLSFEQASALFRSDAEKRSSGLDPQMTRLQDRLAGRLRPASLALMGMMAFVLLIACANVAHLLVSRLTERRQELALRAALGASPARLTRQFITEATMLTALAAAAGMVIAGWTARLSAAALPEQLAARHYEVLDWRVMAFTIGVAAVTGLVFGVMLPWLMGRMQPARHLRGILVATQAALTVALAAGAFAMGQNFLHLIQTDLGFQTTSVVTMSVSLPEADGRIAPFSRDALQRLRAVPGVEAAGTTSYLPLGPPTAKEGTYYSLDGDDGQERGPSAIVSATSSDYFRAMGIPLLEGREFNDGDRKGSAPVVIVTEELANAHPGERLVGRKLYIHPARVMATIAGIVASQRGAGPESKKWKVIYRPLDQYEQWAATFAVRVRGNPDQYLARLREVAQSADHTVPVFDVKTLDERLAGVVARPRFYTTAITFLAAFALLLVIIGAYGAASQTVAQRRHEIGIRVAVGGSPATVRNMVFRQSLAPVVAGAALGLGMAAAIDPVLKSLVASAQFTGLREPAAAAFGVVITTGVAIWFATNRVVKTDPAVTIRVQ